MKDQESACEGGPPPASAILANAEGCTTTASTPGLSRPYGGYHALDAPALRDYEAHKPAYWETAVINYASFDPQMGDGEFRLLNFMVRAVRARDGLMIAGDPKLARCMGKSEKRIGTYLATLRQAKYLRLHRPGGGRGRAAEYQLGEMFRPDSAVWCQKQVSRLLERGSKISPFSEKGKNISGKGSDKKGGQEFHPQPISQPINTHKETPAAFDEKSWAARAKEKFPDWDSADVKASFLSALSKKDTIRDWQLYQNKCHALRRKTQPAVTFKGKPYGRFSSPRPFPSSCESPRTSIPFDGLDKDLWYARDRDWYDLGSEANWEKAGRPHLPSPEKIAECRAKLAAEGLL